MTPLRRLPPLLLIAAAHAGPPEGSQWIPIPELTDEFDGKSLDATKWHDHNPTSQGRQPGFFSKSNVTVRDGKLQLRAKAGDRPDLPDGDHSFTTAAVQSKALVKYGYFEIKCRPMKSKASGAFCFDQSTAAEWTVSMSPRPRAWLWHPAAVRPRSVPGPA